jgi:hypothetical protein
LRDVAFPEHIHGGVRGRSPFTNAEKHLGKRMIVRLDIVDFFTSVTSRQIYSVWVSKLGCSQPVATLLTKLTTYHRHLPQGAPTSTALANFVLLDAEEEIARCASESGCSYTRYVDDLFFSGDHPQDLIRSVVRALQLSGFRTSRDKLALMPAYALQEIAGLSVNSPEGPSVPRYRRHQIRAAIKQLRGMRRDACFLPEKESIRGRITHLSRMNPGSSGTLLKALESVDSRSSTDNVGELGQSGSVE